MTQFEYPSQHSQHVIKIKLQVSPLIPGVSAEKGDYARLPLSFFVPCGSCDLPARVSHGQRGV